MAVALATADELCTLLGETVPAERAALLLELASGLVTQIAGDVAATWSPATAPAAARAAVLAACVRAAANPIGLAAQSAGGVSETYGFALSRAGLYLSDTEKAAIRAAVAGATGGITSVQVANRAGQVVDWPVC